MTMSCFASDTKLDTFWKTVLTGEEIPTLSTDAGTPLEIYKYGKYGVLLGTGFGSMNFKKSDGQYIITFNDSEKLKNSIKTHNEAIGMIREQVKGVNADLDGIKSLFVKLTNTEYLYDYTSMVGILGG